MSTGSEMERASQRGAILEHLQSISTILLGRFRQFGLKTQVLVVTGAVVLAQVAALGVWTTRTLEDAVIAGGGTIGAKYLETFVAPLIPPADWHDMAIDPEAEARLDQLFKKGVVAEHIVAIRIWNRDGSLFYPSALKQAGIESGLTDELRKAFSGKISAGIEQLHDDHDLGFQGVGSDAIEIYAPLVRNERGDVVLVGEFYENPKYLKTAIASQWISSTAIVTIVTIPMLAALFIVAHWASLIIRRQGAAQQFSLEKALRLAHQNQKLRVQAETLRLEAGKSSEMVLDQIGCDLHDGPLQVLTLIRLQLSDLVSRLHRQSMARVTSERLDILLCQAIDDLRNLSAGLLLPEIETLSLSDAIHSAARRHADMTGNSVNIAGVLPDIPLQPHLNICAYRFVQESLMNAHRHAPGSVLNVRYHMYRRWIVIAVVNRGKMPDNIEAGTLRRITLGSLIRKRRVQAFGGRLRRHISPKGTVVVAFLPKP